MFRQIMIAATCVIGLSVPALASPVNVNVDTAQVLTGEGTVRVNTWRIEPGEMQGLVETGLEQAAWYTFTGTGGFVMLRTAGPNLRRLFDSEIRVFDSYDGVSTSSLRLLAQDDNSGGDSFARVRFRTGVGEQYWVAVDGVDGAVGTVRLSYRFLGENFVESFADIAPVPLPAAGLMLLAAIGGLGGAAHLRRKRAA